MAASLDGAVSCQLKPPPLRKAWLAICSPLVAFAARKRVAPTAVTHGELEGHAGNSRTSFSGSRTPDVAPGLGVCPVTVE